MQTRVWRSNNFPQVRDSSSLPRMHPNRTNRPNIADYEKDYHEEFLEEIELMKKLKHSRIVEFIGWFSY